MRRNALLSGVKHAACAAMLTLAPAGAQAGEVSVFAAASLAEVLKDLGNAFEAASGHEVVLTLAGSSALARQIEYGAPADVFVSANAAWVTHLEDRAVLAQGQTKTLFGNDLALAVAADDPTGPVEISDVDFDALLADGRLAMALVEAVPAGIYGRQALENMGLWQDVAPKVAQVDNVRSALALVALGEARAGVVYVTDALAEERVRILSVFPSELHDPIVYPAAVVAGQDRPEVIEFMEFWQSEVAKAAFAERGFRVLEGSE
ncbi:molybdate ABC transporter substrate-binding protein [Shimia sp.]|uniref:molybdate ABC transporter substrate-binding protein n=1 Tax=Shimia sp. TaxID=1954381 RepID=UPI003BAA71DB